MAELFRGDTSAMQKQYQQLSGKRIVLLPECTDAVNIRPTILQERYAVQRMAFYHCVKGRIKSLLQKLTEAGIYI
ncbi:MAG TPA: hypothetical protein VGN63_02050 [Flavisolibacter sp.]|jgi:hypothetical protein|nr:hypothetical protein [Flavisolibacter sp.]